MLAVVLKLWRLLETCGKLGKNQPKFSPILLQQALSSLAFNRFPSDVESHKSLRTTGLHNICCYHLHHVPANLQIIKGSSGKLCWQSIIQKIKLELIWGHRTSHSLGRPKNPVSFPTISIIFTIPHNLYKHLLQLQILYYYSPNVPGATGSLLCAYDSFILENPFPVSLPRHSYLSFKTHMKSRSLSKLFFTFFYSAITPHQEPKSTFHISVMIFCITYLFSSQHIYSVALIPHTQTWKQELYFTYLFVCLVFIYYCNPSVRAQTVFRKCLLDEEKQEL